jgi:hypothetical protein
MFVFECEFEGPGRRTHPQILPKTLRKGVDVFDQERVFRALDSELESKQKLDLSCRFPERRQAWKAGTLARAPE